MMVFRTPVHSAFVKLRMSKIEYCTAELVLYVLVGSASLGFIVSSLCPSTLWYSLLRFPSQRLWTVSVKLPSSIYIAAQVETWALSLWPARVDCGRSTSNSITWYGTHLHRHTPVHTSIFTLCTSQIFLTYWHSSTSNIL